MPLDVFLGTTTDPHSGIETLAFRDRLEREDVLAAFAAITPAPGTRRLWDFRGLLITLAPDVLAALGTAARALDQPGARVALLVDSDMNYGLCRQHLAWRESETVSVAVFREEARARGWLVAP